MDALHDSPLGGQGGLAPGACLSCAPTITFSLLAEHPEMGKLDISRSLPWWGRLEVPYRQETNVPASGLGNANHCSRWPASNRRPRTSRSP